VTSIEWTDKTWNCVTGCTKVSPGCANCYAERVTERFKRQKFTDVVLHPDRLEAPLHWRKPRRVFVNSMSDLFHEAIPDGFIDHVYGVAASAPQHIFQILTKRPRPMASYLQKEFCKERVARAAYEHTKNDPEWEWDGNPSVLPWPLPNVWLGVSCEDQQRADERIPLLLQTPAAVRFVSLEPLLGPITASLYLAEALGPVGKHPGGRGLDWIIVGGESGPKARPCDVAWIRSIRDECAAAGVPLFVKQLGKYPFDTDFDGALKRDTVVHVKARQTPIAQGFTNVSRGHPCGCVTEEGLYRYHRLKNHKGADPTEWPEDLRVREFPR
jgi:protein gp37